MAVTGRNGNGSSAARRTLLAVAVLCLMVLAGAVGCRAVIANRLSPTLDGGPAAAGGPAGTPSGTPSATSQPSSGAATASSPSTTASAAKPLTSTTQARPQPGSLPDVAQALLNQINTWRAADGKAPLTMTSGLVASAHKHNLRMAAGCGMQHQCSGEASLGSRITAEGISWRAIAENIAWHSSVPSSGVLAAATGLNDAMHAETPPDDGHRVNMLNDAYHRVGIDVIRDADGKVWLTEDFAN